MEYASALNHYNTRETFTVANTPGHLHRASAFLHAQSGVAGAFAIFVFVAVFILLPLVLWILALYLAYNCSLKNVGPQALSMIVAFFFPLFYLIFYLIYYTMLGNKCT